LTELPSPPSGRAGWPWTETGPPLPTLRPDGKPWPRISIVTPSLNQVGFIEATLRSVLLQGYPNLEYLLIDGGSTDGTLELVRKYEPWLSYCISEADRGQSDAINKGLRRSSGEVFNWINSDDLLLPGALGHVADHWVSDNADMVVGRGEVVDIVTEALLCDYSPKPPRRVSDFFVPNRVVLAQPSTFLRASVVAELGGVREDLHCVLDWELYLRMILERGADLKTRTMEQLLSRAYRHPDAKTAALSGKFREEAVSVLHDLEEHLSWLDRFRARGVVRHVEMQDQVVSAMSASATPCRDLLRIALRRPESLRSRFFWGAVGRVAARRFRQSVA
jgi:glycosyltransferase involved in cell wall biosynthesis